MDERKQLQDSILKLINKHGGVWIVGKYLNKKQSKFKLIKYCLTEEEADKEKKDHRYFKRFYDKQIINNLNFLQ